MRSSHPSSIAAATLCAVAAIVALQAAASHIDVRVLASWDQTPILAEASEAVAAFDPPSFWRFIDMTAPINEQLRKQLEIDGTAPEQPTSNSPQVEQYARVLSLIPALIFNDAQQKLARSEIASRAFSPRVRAHHDLALRALNSSRSGAAACATDAFFDFGGGRIVCDGAELPVAIASAKAHCHAPAVVPLEDEHVLEPSVAAPSADPAAAKTKKLTEEEAAAANKCEAACVLYGVLGSERTLSLLKLARAAAKAGDLRVTFRHYISDGSALAYPVGLQGFGVTVDVKSMEYKAVDEKKADGEASAASASGSTDPAKTLPPVPGIDMAILAARYPALLKNLSAVAARVAKNAAKAGSGLDLDLKVWEVQKLSYQAAHRILGAKDPMAALTDLTENFPARIGGISRIPSDEALDATVAAVSGVQGRYGDGENRVWLNGRLVESKKLDLFNILGMLREEESLYNRLLSILTGRASLMGEDHPAAVSKAKGCVIQSPKDSPKPKLWIDEALPFWINNISSDDMYASLPRSVASITKPGPYGQPRFARQNLLNMIYVIDPTRRADLEAAASFARVYQQGAAVRFGFLFSFPPEEAAPAAAPAAATEGEEAEESVGHLMAAALYQMSLAKDPATPAMFLIRVVYSLGASPAVTADVIRATAAAFGVDDIVVDEAALSFMRNATAAVRSLGMASLPVAVFNGDVETESPDEALFKGFQRTFEGLKNLVIAGTLTDKTVDKYATIHSAAGAVRRYQPAIFDDVKFQAWSTQAHADFVGRLTWLYATDFAYEVCDVSHVVTINASSLAGLDDATKALEYLTGDTCADKKCLKTRLALVPVDGSRAAEVLVSLLHKAASLSEKKRAPFVKTFIVRFADAIGSDVRLEDAKAVDATVYRLLPEMDRVYQEMLSWSPVYELAMLNRGAALVTPPATPHAGSYVHSNGRVIRIDASFLVEDFGTLERQERDQRGAAVAECVVDLDYMVLSGGKVDSEDVTGEFISNKLIAIGSTLAAAVLKQGPRVPVSQLPVVDPAAGFAAGEQPWRARHTIVAAVDPISRPAQKIVALIQFCITHQNVSARVNLNPARNVAKVPIKNFYRFVAAPELHFEGDRIAAPRAIARGLPTNVVLTLGVDDPESWLVLASRTEDDLDNLKLTETRSVEAEYTLQALVITGACIDTNRMSPPRGLPLEIVDADGVRDTLVMSNYGYFQLRARPGVGTLRIQDGRASDIFHFESLDGSAQPAVAVTSFRGAHVDLRVARNEGQEMTDMLADEKDGAAGAAGGGIFGGMFGSRTVEKWPVATGDQAERPARPTLNVLSLASGHLYERFLRLMMHTVMKSSSDVHGKNTTRIKFWLIEAPMSPRFKKLLPHLAAKYGFEYGLVNYKWPDWLTRQTEKQRLIWAYKVLFLDVLFPLDVEKVIFVDADQIVYGDLHELYHHDLKGKPVGYTPFCRENAREETKGFRFWDSGYWNDHLAGKPYHISAIYVVDLVRLRQLAAGDRYRMIYDNLAQDPNSLANLDQDLPNFAQHQVPIESLPEEWLWCETWCSDASKPKAKTIDLCNNPKTKTPKLENAMRIIPGWKEMDAELAAFEEQVMALPEPATEESGSADL